jgi:acyl-CoA thioesterase I
VATMTANPEWTYASPETYPLYRDELARLCGSGAALADMTAMWAAVLQAKSFADITGNGLNHPNDFGHRVYADVLLGLLIP